MSSEACRVEHLRRRLVGKTIAVLTGVQGNSELSPAPWPTAYSAGSATALTAAAGDDAIGDLLDSGLPTCSFSAHGVGSNTADGLAIAQTRRDHNSVHAHRRVLGREAELNALLEDGARAWPQTSKEERLPNGGLDHVGSPVTVVGVLRARHVLRRGPGAATVPGAPALSPADRPESRIAGDNAEDSGRRTGRRQYRRASLWCVRPR